MHRIFSINSFNDVQLFGRTLSNGLDHIKYLQSDHSKNNYILKMVIQTTLTTKWREKYGLSITDTMNLEFADYMLMVDELMKHTETLSEAVADTAAELTKSI